MGAYFSASAKNFSGGVSALAADAKIINAEQPIKHKRKTEYGRRMTSLRSLIEQIRVQFLLQAEMLILNPFTVMRVSGSRDLEERHVLEM
jgi:hypothetical protein